MCISTEVKAKGRHISNDSGAKSLVDSTQAVPSQNAPASVEHVAVLDAATRLGTDYLDLHLGLELNTDVQTTSMLPYIGLYITQTRSNLYSGLDSTFKTFEVQTFTIINLCHNTAVCKVAQNRFICAALR